LYTKKEKKARRRAHPEDGCAHLILAAATKITPKTDAIGVAVIHVTLEASFSGVSMPAAIILKPIRPRKILVGQLILRTFIFSSP